MLPMITDENFESEITNSKGVILVAFSAQWCGPCRMLTPVLEKIAEAPEFKSKIRILKADVDTVKKAARYQISAIPTMIFFKDGKQMDRTIGFKSFNEIGKMIERVAS